MAFKNLEKWRNGPRAASNHYVTGLRQDAWNVVNKPAAGNVREALNSQAGLSRAPLDRVELLQKLLNQRPVADMHFEQFASDRVLQPRQPAGWFKLHLVEQDFSRQ